MRLIVAIAFASVFVGCRGTDDSVGNTILPLHRFSESLACADPGGSIITVDRRIEGTLQYSEYEQEEVYRTVRENTEGYTFSIPDGRYRVELKFCELEHDAAGKRVFDVMVLNQSIITNLDIFAEVGKDRAYQVTSPRMDVPDGKLTIKFVRKMGSPCIAAISIGGETADGRGYYQHINCGGLGFRGFYADYGN